MNLLELFKAVKDERLPLDKLESYRDTMIHFHTDLQIEMADLEKEEAMFMVSCEEETEAGKKRMWRGSEKGLRLILINRYIKAVSKEINSLTNRIFASIR
jgi:hypothetical protein